MDIKLRYVNHSNDAGNSMIVVFQKNVATDFDNIAVAWKVIKNCGQGDYHPFTLPLSMTGNANDSWGNYTPQLILNNGSLYHVVRDQSGDVFREAGPASSPKVVEMRNDLQQGAVGFHVYRDGRLLATKQGVAPGQKAVFEFKPSLWIGAVSQLEEGELMNSAIVSAINTEISLLGIAKADIVATGGGPGSSSSPLEFTLENIVYA